MSAPKVSGFVSRAMSIAEDIAIYPGDAASRGALYALVTSLQSAAEGLEEALAGCIPILARMYGPESDRAPVVQQARAALSAFNAIKGK